MRLTKYDLCSSCRNIYPMLNGENGPVRSDSSIGDFLDSPGYQHPTGYVIMNQAIKFYLEDNGGCYACKELLNRATDPDYDTSERLSSYQSQSTPSYSSSSSSCECCDCICGAAKCVGIGAAGLCGIGLIGSCCC